MPNVAQVLKEEITRLARKETKAQVGPIERELAKERQTVQELQKLVQAQQKELRRLASAVGKRSLLPAKPPPPIAEDVAAVEKWRKDTVRATRTRLGLNQKEFAALVGVSQNSVCFWETGRTQPRRKQRVAVMSLRTLSPTDARTRLAEMGYSDGMIITTKRVASKPKRARKGAAKKRRR